MDPIIIRPVQALDMPTLHTMNEGAAPAVNSMTPKALTHLVFDLADTVWVALKDTTPLGFIVCMLEGQDYGSANYRWLSERYVTFVYVDRIVVSPQARNQGVGAQLYEKIFDHYSGRRPVLLAEVNLAPPNPASLRFHIRVGFRNTERERWETDGSRGVVYLERPLMALSETKAQEDE